MPRLLPLRCSDDESSTGDVRFLVLDPIKGAPASLKIRNVPPAFDENDISELFAPFVDTCSVNRHPIWPLKFEPTDVMSRSHLTYPNSREAILQLSETKQCNQLLKTELPIQPHATGSRAPLLRSQLISFPKRIQMLTHYM